MFLIIHLFYLFIHLLQKIAMFIMFSAYLLYPLHLHKDLLVNAHIQKQ